MVANRQYQYGTSPRKLDYKTVKKTVKKSVKVNKKAIAKHKAKIFLTIGLVFVAMFAICYRYSLINQKFKEIQSMKKEYLALQTTNDQLEIGIQSSLDLTNVERYAKDKLGMQKAEASQIKYVDIAKEDKVELSENVTKKESVFQGIFKDVTKILD